MNKTDRMLAIVLKLQNRRRVRAEDLAEDFETSKRTIYRDIQALCQAGVPVVSTPGQGYTLVEGYFLPPVSFAADEAVMLLLGADYIANTIDARYQTAARSACVKIEGVLPESVLNDVDQIKRNIRFVASEPGDDGLLGDLRRAVLETRGVRFTYHARNSADAAPGTSTRREADPYGLVYRAGAWYLAAYCHLRRAVRNFRLDRIDGLEVLARTFTRPADFRLEHAQPWQGRDLVARVYFDREAARWVKEARSYFAVEYREVADGLIVTLRVRDERDVLAWLLGWGRHALVLEPESLRRQLAGEARAVAALYQEAPALLT